MFPVYINMPKPMMKRLWNTTSSTMSKNISWSWSRPAMNIKELDDKYVVEVLIGKIDPNEVKVELKDNVLSISYKSQQNENETESETNAEYEYLHQEFSVDSFERSFELPDDASSEVRASYSKGVLTVLINKKPQEPAKQVKVDIVE